MNKRVILHFLRFSVLTASFFVLSASQVPAKTFFVSTQGDNKDGLSWATAWSELKNIQWNVIQPGDVIVLDGGRHHMTYSTPLTIFQKIATQAKPISIVRSNEPGHNGQVVIAGVNGTAISMYNSQYINID